MQRPPPEKNAECWHCLKNARLLMPVAIAPGFAVFTWPLLCMACRLNLRSNDYEMLASDLLHSPHAESRAVYPEWMAAEI